MGRPIVALAPFRNRDYFGKFLNDRGLTGQGAEIGTHRGDFAVTLLSRWKGFLHLVDPWGPVSGYEDQAVGLKQIWGTDGNRDHDLAFCREQLRHYTQRYKVHRTVSLKASLEFADNSLDFVYLDADHRREMVTQDLRVWWGKIKPRGVLAGHDFLCPGEPNGGWAKDIQPPLFALATDNRLTVYMVMTDADLPWSFYLEKSA